MELKRKGRSSVTDGAKTTHSTSASLLTSWSSKTTSPSGGRNGTTWSWMKLRISRTSKVRDGRHCYASTPSAASSSLEPLFKTMLWNSGPSCTSWCLKSSPTNRISRNGSKTLSARPSIRTKVLIWGWCRSSSLFSGPSSSEEWNVTSKSSSLRKSSTSFSATYRGGRGFSMTSISIRIRLGMFWLTAISSV